MARSLKKGPYVFDRNIVIDKYINEIYKYARK